MQDTTTETESVTREITIDAPLEDVWEAVSTDEGRERWLEPDGTAGSWSNGPWRPATSAGGGGTSQTTSLPGT